MDEPFDKLNLFQVQAVLLITDDVDDDAETRRGQKCWHLLPDVGVFVINDVSILRSFIHEILKQNFGGRPQYPALIDLFNQVIIIFNYLYLLLLGMEPLLLL